MLLQRACILTTGVELTYGEYIMIGGIQTFQV